MYVIPKLDTFADRISGNRRRRWPKAVKRQIVVETLEPGLSIVARRHDVTANQPFLCRRRLMAKSPPSGEGALLPIEIVPERGRGRGPGATAISRSSSAMANFCDNAPMESFFAP
jgi:transposase-like protein